jgi:hypothetical protein
MKKGATKPGPPPLLYVCFVLTLIFFIFLLFIFYFLVQVHPPFPLKGSVTRDFSFWFFHKSVSTMALNILYETFHIFRKIYEYTCM